MHQVYLDYLVDSVELPIGETIVGRDVGCALRFNDPAVSRRHLRFIRRDDEVFVEDLSSSNGTVVNGRKLSDPRRVHDGDTIRVGSRMLTLHVVEADDLGESTLLLKNLEQGEERSKMRAVTAQMVVQLPP
ncbi:MAG: FHA domain-containing protein, partial [Deltaproteobacteria bacterium]|nr:FHA domain-containing protein [Deltaproteobacteria bacterium]